MNWSCQVVVLMAKTWVLNSLLPSPPSFICQCKNTAVMYKVSKFKNNNHILLPWRMLPIMVAENKYAYRPRAWLSDYCRDSKNTSQSRIQCSRPDSNTNPSKRDVSGPEGIALGSPWIPLLTTNRRILNKTNFPHASDLWPFASTHKCGCMILSHININ